jgi:hypothetical protein
MSKNNKAKWWIGLILFAGFLLTFFMNLTGLELHQWLGIAVGILATYHLLTHLDWVNAVSERFFGSTSNRSRLYLVINLLIASGFGFILGTGLLMSTWFQINLTTYDFWRSCHVLFSIVTLLLVALKLVLHWRWIATTMHRPHTVRAVQPVNANSRLTPADRTRMSRRQFLGVAGVIGIGTVTAASSAMKGLRLIQNAQTSVSAQEIPAVTQTSQPTSVVESSAASATEVSPTTDATSTTIPATPTTSPINCVVRCNHHCSYPGQCNRYNDLNNNRLCDNGECL